MYVCMYVRMYICSGNKKTAKNAPPIFSFTVMKFFLWVDVVRIDKRITLPDLSQNHIFDMAALFELYLIAFYSPLDILLKNKNEFGEFN
jgi:hypothetical protein